MTLSHMTSHASHMTQTLTKQPLQVINDNTAELLLVGIVKNLLDGGALCILGETNHVLRSEDLDEWEVGVMSNGSC